MAGGNNNPGLKKAIKALPDRIGTAVGAVLGDFQAGLVQALQAPPEAQAQPCEECGEPTTYTFRDFDDDGAERRHILCKEHMGWKREVVMMPGEPPSCEIEKDGLHMLVPHADAESKITFRDLFEDDSDKGWYFDVYCRFGGGWSNREQALANAHAHLDAGRFLGTTTVFPGSWKPLVILGSGPSARDCSELLKRWQDAGGRVMAINDGLSAYPDADSFMCIDPNWQRLPAETKIRSAVLGCFVRPELIEAVLAVLPQEPPPLVRPDPAAEMLWRQRYVTFVRPAGWVLEDHDGKPEAFSDDEKVNLRALPPVQNKMTCLYSAIHVAYRYMNCPAVVLLGCDGGYAPVGGYHFDGRARALPPSPVESDTALVPTQDVLGRPLWTTPALATQCRCLSHAAYFARYHDCALIDASMGLGAPGLPYAPLGVCVDALEQDGVAALLAVQEATAPRR